MVHKMLLLILLASFIPDKNTVTVPGGVEQSKTPGQNPVFYPENPSQAPSGNVPGTLKTPDSPDQHGSLQSPATPLGPRPFIPDPLGYFYPDNNPSGPVKVAVQWPETPQVDPIQLRPKDPDLIPAGNPTGTLKTPGKPDQHGTIEGPTDPYIFKQDPPGSKPGMIFKY